MSGGENRIENRHGKIGCSHEDDVERHPGFFRLALKQSLKLSFVLREPVS
jgi:hypothetical protein